MVGDDTKNLKGIESQNSSMPVDGERTNVTLHLVGGEEIHCGPENALLRSVVTQLHRSLAARSITSLTTDTSPTHSPAIDPAWFPLVLYGDALCGKSMVAHGLANAWKQNLPKKTTFVLTAADIARALKKTELADDIDRLTNQLRNAELLVIDDVQQLAEKAGAQDWLTNLLDYRQRHSKPVIITSNVPIAKTQLTDRLISRLNAGLSVPIALPFAETRRDVILASAKSFQVSLQQHDLDRLVEATSGQPVSGIQSVVASVATHAESNDPASHGSSVADHQLEPSGSVQAADEAELIQKIIRSTGRRFGVKVSDMRGPSRRKNTVLARATAMFILREVTSLSLVEIGKLFRNRDHSTVLHACDKIRKQVRTDECVREVISSVCKSLNLPMSSTWFDLLDAG